MTSATVDQAEGLRWKVTKAVRASSLPSPARLIMLTLADIADVGTAEIPERFTPSLTVLGRETGLGRSTVAAHLRTLERDGWIVRTRPSAGDALARGDRTRYQLKVPTASPSPDLVQEMDGPGVGLPSPGDGTPSPAPRSPSAGAGHRVRSTSDLDQISSDPPPSASLAIVDRPDVERVCNYLAEWIVKNGSKRPTITKKWRTEARLLIDKDGKSLDEIRDVIAWCQRDSFWRSNILSVPKLREKYDQLRLSMDRPAANGHRPSTTDQRVAAAQALKGKFGGGA